MTSSQMEILEIKHRVFIYITEAIKLLNRDQSKALGELFLKLNAFVVAACKLL